MSPNNTMNDKENINTTLIPASDINDNTINRVVGEMNTVVI